MTDPDRDRICVDRMNAGDARGLEELYDRHNDLLYSLILRIVGRVAETEEVLQETWLQAWSKAATYDASRGAVGAWLVTLARSRAIDRVRSLGSRRRAATAAAANPPPRSEDASVGAVQNQLQERVATALASLAPPQREVLELAYFQGLSQSEIAARLATPLGTVKSWTRQGLLRLRQLVPEEEWT
ncbi:MAG TPA: sigma-70 family RNA polymerase sigma factor [Candidatus Eisenbacteria bacterium]|jgi:RNA polymerase sigma-70 factor (ECF subfamily)